MNGKCIQYNWIQKERDKLHGGYEFMKNTRMCDKIIKNKIRTLLLATMNDHYKYYLKKNACKIKLKSENVNCFDLSD